MARDHHRVRIVPEIILHPQRAFEIEVVGRLVEQEQIGLGEEKGRERHAHAPAAGEFRTRPALRLLVEAEAGEDARGLRRRRIGVDVDEAGLDLGDAIGVFRRLALGHECGAFGVGGEHRLEQGSRAGRSFLGHAADARARRHLDRAGFELDLALDGAEQRGLAGAVAADDSHPPAIGDGDRRVVQQETAGDAQRNVVERDHGRLRSRAIARPSRGDQRRRNWRGGMRRPVAAFASLWRKMSRPLSRS